MNEIMTPDERFNAVLKNAIQYNATGALGAIFVAVGGPVLVGGILGAISLTALEFILVGLIVVLGLMLLRKAFRKAAETVDLGLSGVERF